MSNNRFHYRENERVGVITLVAKEGFAFSDVWTDFKQLNLEHQRPETLISKYGMVDSFKPEHCSIALLSFDQYF